MVCIALLKEMILQYIFILPEDRFSSILPVSDNIAEALDCHFDLSSSSYRKYVLRQEVNLLTIAWKAEYDQQNHSAPNETLISLLDFDKLSPDKHKTFKKGLSKSPAIKNSPVNFRRKRK